MRNAPNNCPSIKPKQEKAPILRFSLLLIALYTTHSGSAIAQDGDGISITVPGMENAQHFTLAPLSGFTEGELKKIREAEGIIIELFPDWASMEKFEHAR